MLLSLAVAESTVHIGTTILTPGQSLAFLILGAITVCLPQLLSKDVNIKQHRHFTSQPAVNEPIGHRNWIISRNFGQAR
jgi:hypothetical protein